MEAIVSKLILDSKSTDKIKLISACIPNSNTISSYHIEAIFDTDWWLGNEPEIDISGKSIIKYSKGVLSFSTVDYHEIRGVRPLVTFQSAILKTDDEFLVDKWLFRVIAPGLAVCETVVGYSPYAFKHQKTVPDISDSALFNFLDKWFKGIANKSVFKATRINFDFGIIKKIDMPRPCDIISYHPAFISNGCPFWLKTRYDEFTGYYITEDGHSKEKNISEKLFINPAIFLDTENKSFNNFEIFDMVAVNGRIFKFLDVTNGISICMNPLKPSCYSMGIAEKGNVKVEEEFYQDSEACQVLQSWTSTLHSKFINKKNK